MAKSVTILVRPTRVPMRIEYPISHFSGMEREGFKNKVDNF